MIYLNNAASGWPRPKCVFEAIEDALAKPPEHPGRSAAQSANILSRCRRLIASVLCIENEDRVVLTCGATHSLNLAILGSITKPTDHIVTTATEHNSVLRPISHLSRKIGCKVTVVGITKTGELDRQSYTQAMADNPTLVAVTHASNVTGRINPVKDLFAQAKKAGALTLLDASQTVGLVSVNPHKLNADMVAFTGHKALHGPPGTGGLYVADGIELDQALVGGTGVRSDLEFHPPDMPTRLEAGTPNLPGFAGLAAAIIWHAEHGHEYRRTHRRMADRLVSGLKNLDAIHLVGSNDDADSVGVVSFVIDGWSVAEAGFTLEESFGICCRTGLHCAPLIHRYLGSAPEGTIRLSVSGFSTNEDIDQALASIGQLSTCTSCV